MFDAHFKFQWVKYVEVHKDPDVTITNRSRTYPGVYLIPTGNVQGTLKVFDLNTGVVKNLSSATAFPMPDRFIELVNVWVIDSTMKRKRVS